MNRGSRVSTVAVGVVFGFLLTSSGFGNYATIHQALLFRSWYLYAVFASAMAVSTLGLALLRRTGTTRFGGPLRLPHHPVRRRHIYGAAIFGAGFGICGACPAGAIAMVATGGTGGLLVLTGLIGGLWLRGLTERKTSLRPLPPSRLAGPSSRPDRRGAGPAARSMADDTPDDAVPAAAAQEASHVTPG